MPRARSCIICGIKTSNERCQACYEVFRFCKSLKGSKKDYVLVVDGSFSPGGYGGAGLVLARESDESVVAYCATHFHAFNSTDAEFQAIQIGLKWAPVGVAWSDCPEALGKAVHSGLRAEFIPHDMRDPLHNLAHKLANAARKHEWDKLDKIWIPGEVW